MTRCKFKCTMATQHGSDALEVKLEAVTSGSEENKTFWKYTPSGQLSMWISNPAVFGQFVVGQEYYLDITPAGGAA